MRRSFILICLCALLLICGCAAPGYDEENSVVGFYFDTVVTLYGYCPAETLKAAMDGCAQYERMLSKTIEGSDVWRINHANGMPVKVSKQTIELLQTAKDIGEASGGVFDVSIEPAAALWDFSAEAPCLPDAAALALAVSKVDYSLIELGEDTVTLPAGMQLDLGGIAKGYISACIAEQLKDAGVDSALLDFGGNMVAIGSKPGGFPWRIGIKDPADPYGDVLMSIDCVDCAVVTSGNYERCFDLDGVRYHHILDVRSGLPVQNGVSQFSIVSGDPALADALSTACFALGPEEGLALAERYGAHGICVLDDGSILTTKNFRENAVYQFFPYR